MLDSVALKSAAFRALFAEHPEHLDAIEAFHRDNGGMSRYDKFRWIFRDLLHRPLSDGEMHTLDRRFGELLAASMRSCAFVRGAREFIEAHAARVPLFIASGTPEPELRAIVRDRGLAAFFRGVYGSPSNKTELLRDIIREAGVEAGDVLFIGDGRQDYEAACELGVPFIGIAPAIVPAVFPDALLVAADLDELARRWAEGSAVLNPESR